MKYEELDNETKKDDCCTIYPPNIVYETKKEHKVLKNTVFYLAVAVLLVFNFILLLDLTSSEFTSSIVEGMRDFVLGDQTSQIVDQGSSYVDIDIANLK